MATVWRWPPESEATGSRTRRDAGGQLVEQRPGADLHRHLVELQRAAARGRGRCWRRRRGSRTARGPGTRWRCRASSAALGSASVTGLPRKVIVPELGWWTPASTLTSVDLPAPLSPTSATTSPAWTSRSMSVSAETAPKFLEMPRRLSTRSPAAVGLPVIGCDASSCGGPSDGGRDRAALVRPPTEAAGRARLESLLVIPSFLQPSA